MYIYINTGRIMINNKLKHSKYKNTGFIFELLTRQIATDVLTAGQTPSLALIKKYFKEGSEMYKELMLYKALLEFKTKNSVSIDKLINLSKNAYQKLDRSKLNKEKYNLIKDIKNEYLTESFFDSKIDNYKLYATIYKLFESNPVTQINDYMVCYDFLIETLGSPKKPVIKEVVKDYSIYDTQSPDIKSLTANLIIEKFNHKYQNLNSKQRILMSRFINENTSLTPFKNFVYSEVMYINKELDSMVKSETDKSLIVKLKEIRKLTENVLKAKLITDSHVSALLKFYELIDILK